MILLSKEKEVVLQRAVLRCAVLSLQLCPTLCNPIDCSLPGSSVHGILQARIPEWVTMPSPGNLPDPGIKPGSPALEADALTSERPGKPVYQGLF